MWTITQHGFTSVVAYDARKDRSKTTAHKKIAPNPGTHLLIRARVEEDLFPLKQVCPGVVIETDRYADYSYRAVLSRDLFKKYMALEIDQIGYGAHFKEQFRDSAHQGTDRYSELLDMWGSMAKWQRFTPYQGTDRWSKSKSSGTTLRTPTSVSDWSDFDLFGSDDHDDAWAQYDLAEGSGALRETQVLAVAEVKELILTEGVDGISLSEWASMDRDALALAERVQTHDSPESLSASDLDALALQIVWENSTDAEKEIWVDAGADLPQTSEILEEVDAISRKLANQG